MLDPVVSAISQGADLVLETPLSPQLIGMAYGVSAASIWGAYLAFSRAGVVVGLAAEDIAFLRFSIAGAIMLPWLARNRPFALAGVGFPRSFVLAMLIGPLFILLAVGGYRYAPLAHGAVIQPALVTVGGLALSVAVLAERLSAYRTIGVAVIIVGLITIAGPGFFTVGAGALRGDAMFACAGLMWATFTVLLKRWSVSPMQATAAVSVLSGVVYVPWFLWSRGLDSLLAQPAAVLIPQVIVQGVLAGVVAIIAFTRAVQLLGASGAAVFPALVPGVAILIGIPLIGEAPSAGQTIGLLIVTIGLLVALEVIKRPVR